MFQLIAISVFIGIIAGLTIYSLSPGKKTSTYDAIDDNDGD